MDTIPSQSQECFKVFDTLRKSRQLCDVILLVDGKEFAAHRNILASCSSFFRALFTNGMSDTTKSPVKIPEVNSTLFEVLLDYAYTHEANITTKNVETILPLADRFGVSGLLNICCNFLEENICYDNSIDILRFARCYFCFDLEKYAFRYILKHFGNIVLSALCDCDSNAFVTLTIDELIEMIKDDGLNVKREEDAFEAILKWVRHNENERKKHMYSLLLNIRLGMTRPYYLKYHIKYNRYVRTNEECRKLISQALNYFYNLEYENGPSKVVSRPREPDKILFAIGGWFNGGVIRALECYDSRANNWMMVDAEYFDAQAYAGVAVIDQKVYLIGGVDGHDPTNTVRCFDLLTKTWTEVAPMHTKRCYASAAVVKGYIYVLGGYDAKHRLQSVERYDPKTNQWTKMRPMNKRRSDAAACNINDRVVVVGGFDGERCHDSCEMYDPETNEWMSLPDMNSRRSGCGCVSFQNSVYVIGGFNGRRRLKTMERWSPAISNWSECPSMWDTRSNFGVTVLDDTLFVVGGFDGISTTSKVECFDLGNEFWYDAADMHVERSALSVVVVAGIPDVSEYTWPKQRRLPPLNEALNEEIFPSRLVSLV